MKDPCAFWLHRLQVPRLLEINKSKGEVSLADMAKLVLDAECLLPWMRTKSM